MMKWKMKNKLGEMQEVKLRGIERNGCWFAFWALLCFSMAKLTFCCTGVNSRYRDTGDNPVFSVTAIL